MRTSFTIAGVTATAGTVESGALAIAPRGGDAGTTIPFSIAHGAHDGPVLALTAGVHGSEYVPILALQRLRASIDTASLRGTVLMVHIANVPSFLGRTVYYSPVDGKNLNRVFPGRPDGTLSERIADAITREIIGRATHLVDLHGGDGNESLRPYSYWITTGDPKVAEGSRALALAFGLDHIVVDDERPREAGASVFCSNTAITRGKPAITTETGCLGQSDAASLALAERGIAGVMRHLGLRPDGPAPVAAPVWLKRNVVLRASTTGLFHPAVQQKDCVAAGALIGHVTDFHGKVLEQIVAPFAGMVMYVVDTPPMNAGEPVGMISATDPAGSR